MFRKEGNVGKNQKVKKRGQVILTSNGTATYLYNIYLLIVFVQFFFINFINII